MTAIASQAEALRRAAQAGDFAAAEQLSRSYTDAVCAALPALSPSDAASCLDEACRAIEWSRRYLCTHRSRMREHLRRLHGQSVYQQTPKETAFTWRILG